MTITEHNALRIEQLTRLERGEIAALVLYPHGENEWNPIKGKAIIRFINTPGGRQLAYHTMMFGSTGSGHYGDANEILRFEGRQEIARAEGAEIARRFNRAPLNLYWREIENDADLPYNLQPN